MRVLTFAAGLAAGYVLGARAGREKYEQITAGVRKMTGDSSAEPTPEASTEPVLPVVVADAPTVLTDDPTPVGTTPAGLTDDPTPPVGTTPAGLADDPTPPVGTTPTEPVVTARPRQPRRKTTTTDLPSGSDLAL